MTERQKKQLAIFEFDYHAEILTALCPLLANDFNLLILTTEKIWNKTEIPTNTPGYDVRLKSKKQSYEQFFSRCQQALDDCDAVYINTIGRGFDYYSKRQFKCPVIVRVHNVNATFAPTSHIQFTLRSFISDFGYYLRSCVINRRWQRVLHFINQCDCVLLPSQAILRLAEQKGYLKNARYYSKQPLPFAFLDNAVPYCNEADQSSRDGTTVCAILGSVDPSRKDYDVVIKAVKIFKQRYNGKLQLKLLGAIRGKGGMQVIESFLRLCDKQFSLFYNTDYMPKSEFQRQLKDVQFLIAPIKQDTRFKIFKEQYGISKMSGAENDVITFQRPAIFSANYPLYGDLQKVTKVYRNAEQLCTAMKALGEDVTAEYLQSRFSGLADYEPARIRKNFYQLCQQIAKSNQKD
ncbi:MAG TPA: hypothetical protein VIC26_06315 [Marinagarivorans sp.]